MTKSTLSEWNFITMNALQKGSPDQFIRETKGGPKTTYQPEAKAFFTSIPLTSSFFKEWKSSLNIKFLGGTCLGHQGPRRRDIPDKKFMQVAFFCCFRQVVAGMSRDLGRDVPDLEKLYARNLWADFSFPICEQALTLICPRAAKGGGKLRGGEACYTPPGKSGFGHPPHDTIPLPPLCSRPVNLLRGNRHRPDQSHFLSRPNLGLEGALYSPFSPPPQNRTIRFAPPFAVFQI